VAADGPREVVGELIALFHTLNVRIRFATKIGKAGNVYGWVRSCGNLRVVEIGKSAARVLEAKFIDLGVADRPRILKDASNVAVSLLRGA
jgi:hypothetical protein